MHETVAGPAFAGQLAIDQPTHTVLRAERAQAQLRRRGAVRSACDGAALRRTFDTQVFDPGQGIGNAIGRQRRQGSRVAFGRGEPGIGQARPARQRPRARLVRGTALFRHAQAAVRIDEDVQPPGVPAMIAALGESRRHHARERPGFALRPAQFRLRGIERGSQGPADRLFRYARRRLPAHRDGAAPRQTVHHLEQQGQRGDRAVLAGHRRAIGTTDPHADGIVARAA